MDKIVQGNTSNIIFLKSTDDSMLDTLQKMSGVTHQSFTDSKTITKDKERLFMQNEGKASYTMTTKEVPVISYNDMAFISDRNSIVFRAGDSPIWNRNEMILPMSWRLFSNTIIHPGHDYSLQTIPTLSSALEFDVRKNQPDFTKMLNKRMEQSSMSEAAKQAYQHAYGYSDYEIEQLDPDNYADDIMAIINNYLRKREETENQQDAAEFDMFAGSDLLANAEDNDEQLKATQEAAEKQKRADEKRYAGGLLSREDLISTTSGVNHSLDKDIIECYVDIKGDMWQDTKYFVAQHGDLYGVNGQEYIVRVSPSKDLESLQKSVDNKDERVFAEEKINENDLKAIGTYKVTDEFYRFLVSLDKWDFAKGRFETAMKRKMSV